jgi:hypothetical protein
VADILLLDEGPAIRAPIDSRAPRVRSPVIEGGQTLDTLRAEHGFAALVTISQGGREHRVHRVAPRLQQWLAQHPRPERAHAALPAPRASSVTEPGR